MRFNMSGRRVVVPRRTKIQSHTQSLVDIPVFGLFVGIYGGKQLFPLQRIINNYGDGRIIYYIGRVHRHNIQAVVRWEINIIDAPETYIHS